MEPGAIGTTTSNDEPRGEPSQVAADPPVVDFVVVMSRSRSLSVLSAVAVFLLSTESCLLSRQRYESFTTRTPLEAGQCLVLGFLGGRMKWNSEASFVRKLALNLRAANLPHTEIETVENQKRALALRLIDNAFDRDGDGTLSDNEKQSACIILYGLSFGGAAVVKFARQLNKKGIPIRLTIQVDSVGRNDALIPPNVQRAVNFYQPNGWFIRGEPEIRAEDPGGTNILGNHLYDYRDRDVDISHVHWFRKLGRVAHSKMSNDPEVWSRVEELIRGELIHDYTTRSGNGNGTGTRLAIISGWRRNPTRPLGPGE